VPASAITPLAVEAKPLAEHGAAPAVGSPTVAAAAAATAKAEKAPITARQVVADSVIDVSSVSSVVGDLSGFENVRTRSISRSISNAPLRPKRLTGGGRYASRLIAYECALFLPRGQPFDGTGKGMFI
jgi:hypothetical protein